MQNSYTWEVHTLKNSIKRADLWGSQFLPYWEKLDRIADTCVTSNGRQKKNTLQLWVQNVLFFLNTFWLEKFHLRKWCNILKTIDEQGNNCTFFKSVESLDKENKPCFSYFCSIPPEILINSSNTIFFWWKNTYKKTVHFWDSWLWRHENFSPHWVNEEELWWRRRNKTLDRMYVKVWYYWILTCQKRKVLQ